MQLSNTYISRETGACSIQTNISVLFVGCIAFSGNVYPNPPTNLPALTAHFSWDGWHLGLLYNNKLEVAGLNNVVVCIQLLNTSHILHLMYHIQSIRSTRRLSQCNVHVFKSLEL